MMNQLASDSTSSTTSVAATTHDSDRRCISDSFMLLTGGTACASDQSAGLMFTSSAGGRSRSRLGRLRRPILRIAGSYHGPLGLSKGRLAGALALLALCGAFGCGTTGARGDNSPDKPYLPVPQRDDAAASPSRIAPSRPQAPARVVDGGAASSANSADSANSTSESAVASRLRAAVSRAATASNHTLERDAGLDAACRGAAGELRALPDRSAAVSHLRRWMLDEQVSDAVYLPLTVELSSAAAPPEELLEFVKRELRARGITHVGVGVAEEPDSGRAFGVVALLRRLTELSAFPREVEGGSRHWLWVKPTAEASGGIQVIVSDPAGRIETLGSAGLPRGDGAVPFEIPFAQGPGRYVVQVLADDKHGTQVANLVEVWCDQPPMRVVRVPPSALDDNSEAGQVAYLLEALNRFRERHGLAALKPDSQLEQAARAHSEDMGDGRYFGHVSPRRGGLARRLQEAGLPGTFARENIAMSVSAVWAHESLVESPSHRSAMLDPRVTHVGIAVARRHSGALEVVYVTEIAAELP